MYCRFCCIGDVILIEIFTLYFLINGREVNVIIAVRGLFNDSLMLSWKVGGFELPLVIPEQTINSSDLLCEYKEK
jgi:hypothetical protein